MNPIELLDYAGVTVFAATGALAASRKQLDIIGFLFLASVTGIGGGTFRDIILNLPVFWIANSGYVMICAVVAMFVFFAAHRLESRWKLLLWLDAVGLAAFSVMGAAKGLAITGSPVVAVVTGVLTATFGGILRDMLAGEPSVAPETRNLCHRRPRGRHPVYNRRSRRTAAARIGPGGLRRGIPGAWRRTQIRLGLSILQKPPWPAAGRHSVK
ncbi:membrane hypothetical protein [Mesorhizobium metallidurans STM 2683]|uniref:Glycine transporter domain-containing protein n=1 Tax=Mesorhizobium metallidurans STM 2683 TaxID=1297569 RepID=M5EM14_9HYPH|nr:membrane hypothetical protein [Mesorhizobium metallidurans STM 2683]